jgi:hypothetical protein
MLGIAMSLIASGEERNKTILVESSSQNGKTVLIEARLGGQQIELSCLSSEHGCKKLESGKYLAAPATSNESVYQDCRNFILYQIANNGGKGARIAAYCLLTGTGLL